MRSMDTNNFDYIVKSMMESAQEEVSSRVWSGVQNGLQLAAARHRRIVFFRRAGIAVAAIAAAVALLLTTGLFQHNSIQPNISKNAIALVPEQPAVELPQVELPQVSGREGLLNQAVVSKKTVKEVADFSKLSELEEVKEITETVTVIAETAVKEEETVKEEPAKSATVNEVPETKSQEFFTAMVYQDYMAGKKNGRRVKVGLSGSLGSNGVRTSAFNPPIRRAGQGAQQRNVIRENGESSYKMPVSFGLSVTFPIYKNFSLGSGVTYTSLSRTFPGKILTEDENGTATTIYGDAKHTVKYVGIPLRVYYSFTPAEKHFQFYSYAGGEIERSFVNKARLTGPQNKIYRTLSNSGVQLSVGAGLGIEYKITNHLGFYLDPSVQYFFDNNQPKSIRTQHPWMFNLEAGLRFNLGN